MIIMMKTKKEIVLEDYLMCLKQKKSDDSFGGRGNSYIEYISEGDEYTYLSPEEYLDMIRPYLIDLINDHKTSGE